MTGPQIVGFLCGAWNKFFDCQHNDLSMSFVHMQTSTILFAFLDRIIRKNGRSNVIQITHRILFGPELKAATMKAAHWLIRDHAVSRFARGRQLGRAPRRNGSSRSKFAITYDDDPWGHSSPGTPSLARLKNPMPGKRPAALRIMLD
jgi:hypothetical protein